MKNFIYSDDNKRYHTFNYYLRHKYNSKVFKVPLNAGLGCPNRDGTCGTGGCTFCSELGSGDCAGSMSKPLGQQYEDNLKVMKHKWPSGKPIAYFQAYSNTYAPLEKLKLLYGPFIADPDIIAISIATRPDCLDDEKINYLNDLCKLKDVWIELGLQSIWPETALKTNRGHDLKCFEDCISKLKNTDIKVCVHLIDGLPGETKKMMVDSSYYLGTMPIDAVKIHMLHVIKNTKMGNDYLKEPFDILTRDEYVNIVVEQLEYLPEKIVIERLTGDAVKENLIAPEWTIKKTIVLNEIDKYMAANDIYQGDKTI